MQLNFLTEWVNFYTVIGEVMKFLRTNLLGSIFTVENVSKLYNLWVKKK